jgi:hypothetical protein
MAVDYVGIAMKAESVGRCFGRQSVFMFCIGGEAGLHIADDTV